MSREVCEHGTLVGRPCGGCHAEAEAAMRALATANTQRGWRCPGCGRCYAPLLMQCMHCQPWTTVSSAGTDAPCPHLRVAGDTGGYRCVDCGAHLKEPANG